MVESQQRQQARTSPLEEAPQGVSVVLMDRLPLQLGTNPFAPLVDKVTAVSIAAETLLGKSVAPLCLVRPVRLHIDSQLFRAMCELALVPVGAEPLLGEVLAEGTLGLASHFGPGRDEAYIPGVQGFVEVSGSF